jgi:putative membrane protein
MILPGLSGSFVLILMGNYELIMVKAVSNLNLAILIPVAIGAVLGLLAFSRVLAWVFEKYRDLTISLLTGFVLGSLVVIWPWKEKLTKIFEEGDRVKEKVVGYEWFVPEIAAWETWVAILLMVLGGIVIWLMERFAGGPDNEPA